MNRKKAAIKMATLSWEDLDWIEQKCRELKRNAGGGKFYSSNGDSVHKAQATRALVDHFESVYDKHHGY